jgi:hypothetical protein
MTQVPALAGDWMMSLTIFIAVCVLGIDFLIYVLFQWTFADKRQALQKKLAAERQALQGESARPFLVSSRKIGPQTQARLQKVRERMATAVERERRSA